MGPSYRTYKYVVPIEGEIWQSNWDTQAIARAHRYGQTKPCLVFKLMVKGSAEGELARVQSLATSNFATDKIMQTGKKKLVLDHLIVQKMDDEDGPKEDVQSTLLFGAKALFEEGASDEHRQIHCELFAALETYIAF